MFCVKCCKPGHWVVLLCTLLAGCDALESNEDTKAKEALVGSWYWEYAAPNQPSVREVVTLAQAGTFAARQRVGDEPRETKSTGPWYVTDGEFKLQTTEMDGKALGVRQMTFFTCKLAEVRAREFTCVWGAGERKFSFRRVQGDMPLM